MLRASLSFALHREIFCKKESFTKDSIIMKYSPKPWKFKVGTSKLEAWWAWGRTTCLQISWKWFAVAYCGRRYCELTSVTQHGLANWWRFLTEIFQLKLRVFQCKTHRTLGEQENKRNLNFKMKKARWSDLAKLSCKGRLLLQHGRRGGNWGR